MPDSVTSLQHSFGPALKPFAWMYGKLMRMRAMMYERNLAPSWAPEAVTVSVGNIGWGGSGKTPIAGWFLGWAENRALDAMLLTRGYKAKPVKYPYLVKPGALAEEAGDEPLMLATEHTKARIIVDPERSRGGRWGCKTAYPDIVVLDDGFQHMAVKRDFNLVLLRPEDLTHQWDRVIPAGSWREPVSALKRADAFMIKLGPRNFKKNKQIFADRLGQFRKPVFSFQVVPTGLRQILNGNVALDFDGGNYLLVTGVGNPEQVKRTASGYFGYKPQRHLVYRDHHTYTKSDVLEMQQVASKLGCTAILCTPKDAVKLGPMCTEDFWQFDLRVDFGPSSIGDDVGFDSWWERYYEKLLLRQPGRDPQSAAGKKNGKEKT